MPDFEYSISILNRCWVLHSMNAIIDLAAWLNENAEELNLEPPRVADQVVTPGYPELDSQNVALRARVVHLEESVRELLEARRDLKEKQDA